VTAGMFSINDHPIVVLFGSRSSHSFISQAFAKRYEQKIVELECAYQISSAGADLLTNQIVRGVTMNIAGRQYMSRNYPNYKSTSTKTITGVIKFSHLSPYNSGSPIKSRGISNQPTYKLR
jgi:hypothetical protein